MPLLLALNKLVRPQSHALAQAGHHERVRNREEREVLAEGEVLSMQEDDGLVCERREARVEVRHDVRDATLHLVLLRCLKCDLDEHNLALVLGVLVQERLKRLDLLPHALNIVELVASNNNLHARISLTERAHPLGDFRVASVRRFSGGLTVNVTHVTYFSCFKCSTSIPIGNTPTSTKRSSVWMPFGSASTVRMRLTVCLKCRA